MGPSGCERGDGCMGQGFGLTPEGRSVRSTGLAPVPLVLRLANRHNHTAVEGEESDDR